MIKYIFGYILVLLFLGCTNTNVYIFEHPISDQDAIERIITRLDQDGIKTIVSNEGIIKVKDKSTASRARAILINEDLVPSGLGLDPWSIFDRKRWNN